MEKEEFMKNNELGDIFRLEVWSFGNTNVTNVTDIHHTRLGIYSTIENAESAMKKFLREVHDEKRWDDIDIAAFSLIGIRIDQNPERMDEISDFESVRTYDRNGNVNAVSNYDSYGRIPFVGNEESPKFSHGEICMVINRGRSYPAIVSSCPYTKKEWSEHFKDGVLGDVFDNTYNVIGLDKHHHHVMTPFVFGCYNGVSDDVKKELSENLKAFENGEIL